MTEISNRLCDLGPFHLPVAAALHDDAFGREAWSEKGIAETIAMPGSFGRLAAVSIGGDDLPAGFALGLVAADEAELLTIAVAGAFRRAGVGRELVRDFIELATRAGARHAFLEVAEDNIPALALYRSFDFEAVGRRPDYYHRGGNLRVSALLLRRALR